MLILIFLVTNMIGFSLQPVNSLNSFTSIYGYRSKTIRLRCSAIERNMQQNVYRYMYIRYVYCGQTGSSWTQDSPVILLGRGNFIQVFGFHYYFILMCTFNSYEVIIILKILVMMMFLYGIVQLDYPNYMRIR